MHHSKRTVLCGGLTALCLMLFAGHAAAQRAALFGQTATKDGQVVSSTFVELRALDLVALSDSSGLFRFDTIPAGRHLLHFKSIGFLADSVEVVVEEGGTQVTLRLQVDTVALRAFTRDTTPRPFPGGIRLGLSLRAARHMVPELRVWLRTEHEYGILGYVIATRTSESVHRIDLEIRGTHGPVFGPGAMGPAVGSAILDPPVGGPPDTLAISYASDTDRYLVRRTASHAYIRPLEASFTTLAADSLELANPGTVRVRCAPAGYPVEDCARFVADIAVAGIRSDTLTPQPETLRTRAFGSTWYEAIPDSRERWLIAHGLVEADIARLIEAAEVFTASRLGDSRAFVTLDIWDSRSIQCVEGTCSARN